MERLMVSFFAFFLCCATAVEAASVPGAFFLCSADEFQCLSNNACVPAGSTCDGKNDCPDGSDEINCQEGCPWNGTRLPHGRSLGDDRWWYSCSRSRWVVSGCSSEGLQVGDGQTFRELRPDGRFWGVCKKTGQSFFVRLTQGCVDQTGRDFGPGQIFRATHFLWGECRVNTTEANVSGTLVTLNDVSWKAVGCNNGSNSLINDGEEFVHFEDPVRFIGARLKCDLKGPKVKPQACLIGLGDGGAREVRRVNNGCYTVINDSVAFCTFYDFVLPTIGPNAGDNATSWSLTVVPNNSQVVRKLSDEGYAECSSRDKQMTEVANSGKGLSLPNLNYTSGD